MRTASTSIGSGRYYFWKLASFTDSESATSWILKLIFPYQCVLIWSWMWLKFGTHSISTTWATWRLRRERGQYSLCAFCDLLSLHNRYADGSHVKYSWQYLHNETVCSNLGYKTFNIQKLHSRSASSHTSPRRALIFKGTIPSARVRPTLTIAVAAPASWAALWE